MSVWINGRRGSLIDYRDRGLQYGDGVFETMLIRRREIRFLGRHLERLHAGCERLHIAGPPAAALRRELETVAAQRREGVVKLIVTRGRGARGYRPSGRERCTRIVSLHPLPRGAALAGAEPVRVRLCSTALGANPALAGLKTLNRLESVMARSEWSDPRIWEGLMQDAGGNIVCGTMSNLFLKSGSLLMTPMLDRCGVAGVMRRWILDTADELRLRTVERRIRWRDVSAAEEVFMSNAVAGVRSVAVIERGRERLKGYGRATADELRSRLDAV